MATRRQVRSGNDFPIYVEASRAIVAGESPYDVGSGLHGYVYPPFFAILIAPIAFLPLTAAVWAWYLINVLLTVAAFGLLRRLLEAHFGPRRARTAVWIALVVHLRFVLNNYDMGQVNLLTLVMGLAAVWLAFQRGRYSGAGWLIGASAAIKPYAVVLALPFLLRGQWRMMGTVLAGWLIAMVVPPLLVAGPSTTAAMLRDWNEKVILPSAGGRLQGSATFDQSPQSALRRLVVDAPAFGETHVNFVSVSPGTYRLLVRLLQLALLVVFLAALVIGRPWTTRGERAPPASEDTAATLNEHSPAAQDPLGLVDIALSFLATVMLFGYNLKAHFVVLIVPASIIAWLVLNERARIGRVATGLAIVAGVLVFFTAPFLVGRPLANWAAAYSATTLATLLQFGWLVWWKVTYGVRERHPVCHQ
jgi:hypothetical protein